MNGRHYRLVIAAACLLPSVLSPAVAQQRLDSLSIVLGDGQNATLLDGVAKFQPIVVQLLDPSGNPLAGQAVDFNCVYGGYSCQFSTRVDGGYATVVTDQSGRASVPVYGQIVGPLGVQVATSNAIGVTFNLSVIAPSVVSIVSGNNQSINAKALFPPGVSLPTSGFPNWSGTFQPLTVAVAPAKAGSAVTWICSAPTTIFCPGGIKQTTTDGTGKSTLSSMLVMGRAGAPIPTTVTITARSGEGSAAFTLKLLKVVPYSR